MSWDKSTYLLIRSFKKSPIGVLLIAYLLSRIPILHCLWPSTDTCQDVKLNLFIIEFPYRNLVDFIFTSLCGLFAIEFFFRARTALKLMAPRRDVEKLKKQIQETEDQYGESERSRAAKIEIKKIEKHMEDLSKTSLLIK